MPQSPTIMPNWFCKISSWYAKIWDHKTGIAPFKISAFCHWKRQSRFFTSPWGGGAYAHICTHTHAYTHTQTFNLNFHLQRHLTNSFQAMLFNIFLLCILRLLILTLFAKVYFRSYLKINSFSWMVMIASWLEIPLSRWESDCWTCPLRPSYLSELCFAFYREFNRHTYF